MASVLSTWGITDWFSIRSENFKKPQNFIAFPRTRWRRNSKILIYTIIKTKRDGDCGRNNTPSSALINGDLSRHPSVRITDCSPNRIHEQMYAMYMSKWSKRKRLPRRAAWPFGDCPMHIAVRQTPEHILLPMRTRVVEKRTSIGNRKHLQKTIFTLYLLKSGTPSLLPQKRNRQRTSPRTPRNPGRYHHLRI